MERIAFSPSPDTKQWLEQNYRSHGFPTVSKFVSAIVVGYRDAELKVVVVPLHGSQEPHLGGEAQAPQHSPYVGHVVLYVELLLDDFCYPLQSPELSLVAVVQCASLEYTVEFPFLGASELLWSAGASLVVPRILSPRFEPLQPSVRCDP